MTRDEAIKSALKFLVRKQQEQGSWGYADRNENEISWDKVLEWLEKQPCENCIRRQATLGCCRNEWEEDIAKAFQFGLALGFGKKHDEMDKVMEEVKKAVTPQPKILDKMRAEIAQMSPTYHNPNDLVPIGEVLAIIDRYKAESEEILNE